MNKTELVEAIATGAKLTKAEASRVLDTFMTTITDVLKSGDQVVIPGFGSFCITNRAEREGRNPKTGEKLKIKAARIPKFKAGKTLKDAVQE